HRILPPAAFPHFDHPSAAAHAQNTISRHGCWMGVPRKTRERFTRTNSRRGALVGVDARCTHHISMSLTFSKREQRRTTCAQPHASSVAVSASVTSDTEATTTPGALRNEAR